MGTICGARSETVRSRRYALPAVLAAMSFPCAWAQQATLPAAALARQASDAAGWVAQQRSDAADALGQGRADAAGSVAWQASDAAGSIARQSAEAAAETVPRTPAPLMPNPEYANFPRYTGTLGSRRIVLRLGRKAEADDPTGVHGEYQFVDTGEVVLVAGDREGDVLEIEDSDDGSTITGNWVGRFGSDGSLTGQRMNPDDSGPQPFVLHPLAGPLPTP
jgi:hypothetical protein